MPSPENLGLSDSDFFLDELPQPPRPAYGTEHGVVLAAPAKVLLPVRKAIPVLVRRRGPMKDLATLPTVSNLVLHTVDVDRNRLFSCPGGTLIDNAVERPRDPAEIAQMKGENTEYEVVDLAGQAGIPLRPAELFVVGTLRDKATNVRRISVEPGPGVYTDPAVDEFLQKKRGELPPDPPTPGATFERVEGSPKVPEKPGIVISAERVTLLEKGAKLLLKGAFRVPVRKQDLVDAKHGRPEKAVVEIWFSLSGAEKAAPLQTSLRVPVAEEPKDGFATGTFSFDLLQRVQVPFTPETYFLSMFSRDVFTPPQPLAFITRASLPPGAK